MDSNDGGGDRDRWARLRFAVVGPLLASPPPAGQLRAELERLSQRDWDHPSGKGPVRFAVSTIERWYYQARSADQDPVKALRRRPRADAGRARAMSPALIQALRDQHRAHPSWSAQLHHENLGVLVEADPALGPMPSYATLTRAMRNRGLVRQRRRRRFEPEPAPAAETREVLSYEVSRSHGLWHCDMHHGKRRVPTPSGEWKTPILLGFLDDHSRLGCHLQWYLAETAEVFVHGLCQAFMKRGLPRALMSDNGSAMTAGEVTDGLHRLGIVHVTTLAYAPYQNGKMEVLWAFRNGAVPVKLHFSIADRRDTIIRSRSLGACGRLYPPGVVRRSFRGHRGTGSGLDDCNASLVLRRNHDPGCVRRQALASVRGQRGGCQLHAWSKTIPECQSQSRARTRWYGSATRPTTCIIGNRVPARGHRWIAHLQARLFPPC